MKSTTPATTRPPGAGPAAAPPHWGASIPPARLGPLRLWLYGVAATTFAVLVVGGITRLTLSGLSIVEWNPVMGVLPPLTDAQWHEAFERYRQSPDYLWRQGMTLADFRFIYFWEYLHRLLARAIGLVFAVPFAVFLLRGWLNRPLLRRTLVLFGLGALQGVMGWLMVKSGLVDRPSVSHYRLAAHLALAFIIFGWAVWLARELTPRARRALDAGHRRRLLRSLGLVGAVLGLQIVWGAFVAGLRAGKVHATFPLMAGRLTPPDMLRLDPPLLNFLANPAAVQWTHRVIGTFLLIAAGALLVLVRRRTGDRLSRRLGALFLMLVAAQYALGVATLLLLVPVSLGVLHQAMALVLFGLWLVWLHHTLRSGPAAAGAPHDQPRSG